MIPTYAALRWYVKFDSDGAHSAYIPELIVELDDEALNKLTFEEIENGYFMCTTQGYHDAFIENGAREVRLVLDVDSSGVGDERTIPLTLEFPSEVPTEEAVIEFNRVTKGAYVAE